MNRKTIVFCLALTITCISFAYCDESEQARSLFYQGNAKYSEERYEQAIENYEQVLSLGLESGPLYYNLANAYFKKGYLGKAILNYMRAQRLMPQDADLKSNLAYAQSQIKGGKIAFRRKWFVKTFLNLAEQFSLDTLTIASSVLYFLLAIFVVIYLLVKKIRKIMGFICITALVVSLGLISLFCGQFFDTQVYKKAIVVIEYSDCKFEPFDDATTHFTLYEGESVVTVGEKADWIKVKRLDGKQGWIRQRDIEFL